MKRILNFLELPPILQRAAVEKVSRLAEARARYCGEIWAEGSHALAETARFTMTIRQGIYTSIWDVEFARSPRVMPGTEYRPFANANANAA